jgi:hypothetical protein
MDEGSDGDPRIKIVYEEAVRGWSLQSSVLDEIRSRTGVLLAAATIASTLLGGTDALRHDSFTFLGVVAVVMFCCVVGLCVYVLWPSHDWTFTHDSRKLIEAYVGDGKSIDYMRENLAFAADDYRTTNDKKLACQFNAFRWASLLLGISVVLWLIDIT